MASVIRVPKANGPAGEASRMTASEAKNGFGRVLDRVAKDGARKFDLSTRKGAASHRRRPSAARPGPPLAALTAHR